MHYQQFENLFSQYRLEDIIRKLGDIENYKGNGNYNYVGMTLKKFLERDPIIIL